MIVVGSGVAGLTAALGLHAAGVDVAVVTKGRLGESTTAWAQGGVAAALGTDDTPASHAADTIRAAAGLALADVVQAVTASAPQAVADLEAGRNLFARRSDGAFDLHREGGHSAHRIAHADSDATGAAVIAPLVERVLAGDLRLFEGHTAVDFQTASGRVTGVRTVTESGRHALGARAVVLATGGLAGLYARSTNPASAVGDGLALAASAGAVLADLEFVQFHPTALDVAADPLPLITEALRGAGAVIVDEAGSRIMVDRHPMADLAPRDVVARTIWEHMAQGRQIYLDTRRVDKIALGRFVALTAACRRFGLDPEGTLLPITPAAHYHVGGVATNGLGRSSVPGLWACGEAASTGLHGANRLASNSLLEGLVFGRLVAQDVVGHLTRPAEADDWPGPPVATGNIEALDTAAKAGALDGEVGMEELRRVMWQDVGISRDGPGLDRAVSTLEHLRRGRNEALRRAASAAWLVAAAARRRTESRGAHYRSDYPRESTLWAHRLFVVAPWSDQGAVQ